MPLGTSLGTGSISPKGGTTVQVPPTTPSIPPGAQTNSSGQYWDPNKSTWVTPAGMPPTYPGKIPFTTGPSTGLPGPTPTPNTGSTPSSLTGSFSTVQQYPTQGLYTPSVGSSGPSASMQWLNSQLALLQAQAQGSNADLAALARAQAAAARAGGAGSPPPDWQLMKDKLIAALKNSKTDYANTSRANHSAVRGINDQYTNAFNNLTSDATARGAVTSRGYGLGLQNASNVKLADLARQAKYMADAKLALSAANQAYGFGLRDIADQQRRWGAGQGAAAAAANAQVAAIMAQLNMQQNANNAAAIQAQLGLVSPLISSGAVLQQDGLNALLGPNFSMGAPKKPTTSRPVGYQRV